MSNKVALIYRAQKNKRYSIETLFMPIEGMPEVEKIVLPCELNSFSNFWRLLFFSFSIKNKVVHITGDVHYMAIFLFWKKIIITIHDVHHHAYLKGIKRLVYGILWFKLPLLTADKIVVISPITMENLKRTFRFNESKALLIPNTFNKSTLKKENLDNNSTEFVVLCVGTGENKNIDRLIIASREIPNIKLRIIGKLTDSVCELLMKFNISYENRFHISREELEKEYLSASILYFASTQEGFGLPILEAQSAGLPVLTSNVSAMPFVAGEGALLVDPFNIEDIKKGVLTLKNSYTNRELLITKGYENINRFRLETFKEAYADLYRDLSY